MAWNLFEHVKAVPVAAKAADNEQVVGDAVDTAGYEGVAFVVVVEAGENGLVNAHAQQASQADFSDGADLEGTSVAFEVSTGSKGFVVLDVYQPRERYVRPVVTVPDWTSPKAVGVMALLYGGRKAPVGNQGTLVLWPEEGTP